MTARKVGGEAATRLFADFYFLPGNRVPERRFYEVKLVATSRVHTRLSSGTIRWTKSTSRLSFQRTIVLKGVTIANFNPDFFVSY